MDDGFVTTECLSTVNAVEDHDANLKINTYLFLGGKTKKCYAYSTLIILSSEAEYRLVDVANDHVIVMILR